MSALYDSDFSEWIEQQKLFLKEKDFEHLDIEHLLEEMESMGKSDKRALESHLKIILVHLLKQKYQPSHAGKSWQDSIDNGRLQIEDIFEMSPNLKKFVPEIIQKVYLKARRHASNQTGIELDKFSKTCEWTLDDILGK